MYRCLTDGAKHFESGSCVACIGQSNARRTVYSFVQTQKGGQKYLSAPLLLTNGENQQGGYSDSGPNYRCQTCAKTFKLLSGMLQHLTNSPQCGDSGAHVNVRLGPGHPALPEPPRKYRFYHGSTWDAAYQIQQRGFLPSQDGCLGPGVYVAREDKATRFAKLRAEECGHSYGGLVELLVTVRDAKYVLKNDLVWQSEGYDACRAEQTTASTNMEWCIRDPNSITVLGITPVYI